MAKTSYDYFLEQKQRLEQQQFRDNLMLEVEFALKAFREELRQEFDQKIKQEVYQQQQNQKVEVKIDTDQITKEIQKAFRF